MFRPQLPVVADVDNLKRKAQEKEVVIIKSVAKEKKPVAKKPPKGTVPITNFFTTEPKICTAESKK